MDKAILKKIAKEWCKGILIACDSTSFEESADKELLDEDEIQYILDQTKIIAERITKEPYEANLNNIVEKYYSFD